MTLSSLGLVKTTLIDFPGEVAATVFTPGCNLRCPYCHNPELVIPPFGDTLFPIEEVRRFLAKRAAVLGGVCITGGEPLIHAEPQGDLYELINFCKGLGLKVKLDTNGCFPGRLMPLLSIAEAVSAGEQGGRRNCLDYIAMDIKTVPEKYAAVVRGRQPAAKPAVSRAASSSSAASSGIAAAVRRSIELIIRSGIPHEFRTTMAPGIAGTEDVIEIARFLQSVYAAAAEQEQAVRDKKATNGGPKRSSVPASPAPTGKNAPKTRRKIRFGPIQAGKNPRPGIFRAPSLLRRRSARCRRKDS